MSIKSKLKCVLPVADAAGSTLAAVVDDNTLDSTVHSKKVSLLYKKIIPLNWTAYSRQTTYLYDCSRRCRGGRW